MRVLGAKSRVLAEKCLNFDEKEQKSNYTDAAIRSCTISLTISAGVE
jgi:hypothetical protein